MDQLFIQDFNIVKLENSSEDRPYIYIVSEYMDETSVWSALNSAIFYFYGFFSHNINGSRFRIKKIRAEASRPPLRL